MTAPFRVPTQQQPPKKKVDPFADLGDNVYHGQGADTTPVPRMDERQDPFADLADAPVSRETREAGAVALRPTPVRFGKEAAETTNLSPDDEDTFQQWGKKHNLSDIDHPDSHYDYRGAFAAGVEPKDGHWPDTFKQHGHPTFSVESQYSTGPGDGGHWEGETFHPAEFAGPPKGSSREFGEPATTLEKIRAAAKPVHDAKDEFSKSHPGVTERLSAVSENEDLPSVVRGAAMAGSFVSGLLEHPEKTFEGLVTMPIESGDLLGRYAYQKAAEGMGPGAVKAWKDMGGKPIEGKEAGWAAAQLAALNLGPGLSAAIEKRLSAAIESRWLAGEPVAGLGKAAKVVSHAAPAALAGAAYTPKTPLVGATAGALLGGAEAAARGEHVAASGYVEPDQPALPRPAGRRATATASISTDPFSDLADAPAQTSAEKPTWSADRAAATMLDKIYPPGTGNGHGPELGPEDFARAKREDEYQRQRAGAPTKSGEPIEDIGAKPAATSNPAAPEPKKYDFSSTQFDLPPEHAAALHELAAKIPDGALNTEAGGRETEPHITVKYGLHGNEPQKVRALLADQPPITVTLGKTSIFPADEKATQRGGADVSDVVKVDVDSPELHALNKKIADALPHTDTFPEYKPHATVAYVKPGLGKRFAGDASVAGRTMTLDRLTFSGQDGKKIEIPLTGAPVHPIVDESSASPRTPAGTLRANLTNVTDAALIGELAKLHDANMADGALVVPTVSAEANVSNVDGNMHHHVGMKGAAVNASGRIAQRKKTIAKIETHLAGRGWDETRIMDALQEHWASQPKTEFDTPEIIEARRHTSVTPETISDDSPEREEMQLKAAEQHYDNAVAAVPSGVRRTKDVGLVIGPSGSGKTSIAVTPLANHIGGAVFDTDAAKRLLPEFHNGKGSAVVFREAGRINEMARDLAASEGHNFVFPTVGASPENLKRMLDALHAEGYRVHVRHVDAPEDVAARRAVTRYTESVRNGTGDSFFVDPQHILQMGGIHRRSYEMAKKHPGTVSYAQIDNSIDGERPRVVEAFNAPDVAPDTPQRNRGEASSRLPGGSGLGGHEARGGADREPPEGSKQDDVDDSDIQYARVPSRDARQTGLFADEPPPEPEQESLFGGKEGTAAARNLKATERAAVGELDKLRQQLAAGPTPLQRIEISRRMAELEKLVNRDKAISADEMRTRAASVEGGGLTEADKARHAALQTMRRGSSTIAGYRGASYTPPPSYDMPIQSAKTARRRAMEALAVVTANGPDSGNLVERALRDEIARLDAVVSGQSDVHAFRLPGRSGGQKPPKPPRPAPPQSAGGVHPTPEPSGLTQNRPSFRIREVLPAIRSVLMPESLGPNAKSVAGTIRHQTAVGFRQLRTASEALDDFKKAVGKLSKDDAIAYWDAAEHGRSTGDPEFDAGNKLLRDVTQGFTDELIALDRMKAESTIDNYIGRFWSKPTAKKAADFLRRIMGKRPLEGPKSFLKQRSLDNFVDGLDVGLIPATYNYVESQLAKIAEMQRVITAERMLRAELAQGRAQKVLDTMGKEPPVDANGDKWVRIGADGDPAFTIYGPPTVEVHEAFDAGVREGIENAIQHLGGVKHTRATTVGRVKGMKNALGWAKGDTEIASKFASHDGVILHELGHVLDARFGLQRILSANPQELKALAKLRYDDSNGDVPASFKKYVQKPEEQMANALHALIHAPELMEEVAPKTKQKLTDFLDSRPDTRPILDIKPSLRLDAGTAEQRVPGFSTLGHWYAPKDAAAVWNAHLSRGLRGNPLYDAATAPGKAATQILLGISGFHGTVIATEGMFSDMVLGAEQLMSGKPIEAAKAAGRVVGSPVTSMVSSLAPKKILPKVANLAFGAKVMAEYSKPGTHPELARVIEAMVAGGFRGQTESELWAGDRTQAFRRAIRQALHGDDALTKAWGASKIPLDGIYAGIELAAKPLMSKYVPLMKTAATYHAVAQRLGELPAGAPPEQIEREMWDVVKEMDLRFGLVTYDNHFINNTAKHLAQAMFLAPGWTFGTLGLMGRGARDVGVAPKRLYDKASGKPGAAEQPVLGRSGKYWVAAVAGTMLLNGMLTYLSTGETPGSDADQRGDGWKDFFAFRDGTKDSAGNPNRHTIPGYLMHDVYGWTHHPYKTFMNKLSPFWAFSGRVVRNETYYGDMVRDPDAPVLTQAKQVAKATDEFLPLSVQNYLEGRKREESGSSEIARNVFGVGPAKREFVRTPAQNRLAELLARRGHPQRTPDAVEKAEQRADLRTGRREGTVSRDSIVRLERSGELSRTQEKSLLNNLKVRENPLVTKFKMLTDDEAREVFDLGTEAEQRLWKPVLHVKDINARRAKVGRGPIHRHP